MSSQPAPAPLLELAAGGAGDLDAVMAVMKAAFSPRFGEGWSRSQCAGILPLPGVGLTLARLPDGKVAGFALKRAIADESELLLLAVDPQRQRRGIGRALLDQFVDEARRSGIARLHLEVRAGNPAIAMYRDYGFAPVGRRSNYYRAADGQTHDAITMALDIA